MSDHPKYEILSINYKQQEDPKFKEYEWKQYLMQAADAGFKVVASFQIQHADGTYVALVTERWPNKPE